MARTRIFQTGMEWNDLLLEWTSYVNPADISVSSTIFRSGLYSLRIDDTANTTYVTKVFDAAISQAGISLHMNHGNVEGSETPDIFTLTSGATNIFRLRWNGTSFLALCGATQVATGVSVPFSAVNSWKHISVDVKIDAAGWVKVYCEGALVIDYTGTTNQGGANFNSIRVGPTDSQNWSILQHQYYDDIYVDNLTGEVAASSNPDRRFYFISPNGNGFYSQWEGVDEDTVDNYLQVDELPQDGDTTRVEAADIDLYDSYEMTSFVVPVGWTVEAIIPSIVAKKDDAFGTYGLVSGTRLGVTNQESTLKTLGTSYQLFNERQVTKPGGGAWDQASLDDVEVLIKSAT